MPNFNSIYVFKNDDKLTIKVGFDDASRSAPKLSQSKAVAMATEIHSKVKSSKSYVETEVGVDGQDTSHDSADFLVPGAKMVKGGRKVIDKSYTDDVIPKFYEGCIRVSFVGVSARYKALVTKTLVAVGVDNVDKAIADVMNGLKRSAWVNLPL